MFRAYGTAPPETATAGDLYTWNNSPFYNKGDGIFSFLWIYVAVGGWKCV